MRSNFLSNYFGFNRQQRNGLLVLMSLSLLLLFVRLAYPHFIAPGKVQVRNLPLIRHELDSTSDAHSFRKNEKHGLAQAKLFVFDPNVVTAEELQTLGLSQKQAAAFVKMRNRGFRFRSKEDLAKVYVISPKNYERLAPFVRIGKAADQSSPKNTDPTEKPVAVQAESKVELNEADSVALEKLPGIGPSFARRIIKYRELLGGYTNIEQLKEVYGFNDELFAKVSPHLTVSSSSLRRISVNSAEFRTLSRHPYLGYENTKKIFALRKKGTIDSEALAAVLNDQVLFRKVLPYLSFE